MKNRSSEINYNPYFLEKIQPVGGVRFTEEYIRKGDGYETCISIYDYPKNADYFWLEKLLSFDDAIITIDIATEKKDKVLKQINRSLSEQMTRVVDMKDNIEKIKASSSISTLTNLVEDMTSNDEMMKLIKIRYFLSARTKAELDVKVKKILNDLEGFGYRGAIFLNEQEYEWKSLFLSSKRQLDFPNRRIGKGVPSITLGSGYPFHFTELNDPTGTFLGTTKTGGNVIFDLFTKDDIRKSYNALLVGMMGSGKSTTLKKLLKENAIVGNTIRLIDITGEFNTLVKSLSNGKVITLDGTGEIINPLQIFATVIDEDNNIVLDEQSYTTHLSKLMMMYQYFSPNAESGELRIFSECLSKFYVSFGIEKSKATRYKINEYPIMEDFAEFIKKELYIDVQRRIVNKELSELRQQRLENVLLTIEEIVRDYGNLFNGYSSISDISNEQIISFELRNLTQFEPRIFNAQLFNVLTMIWNNALTQGLKEKKAYDEGEKSIDETKKYLVFIDEAHKIVNTSNLLGVDYIVSYMREARKYFAGIILATQSIRDVVPESTNDKVLVKMQTLFELTLYKFIMQQDNNAKESLKKIFSGQLSDSEIESIPYLGIGDCILTINGGKNINFHIETTKEELKLFKGGA
ncbi:VirB4 family type IV secretion system protein [Clostridium baratii]|uniref:Type IV secretory pathway VirB4 component-like protein n=1 Tax=Clostridium baratii TaxID=1561 RepID=A0A174V670_9CLOT|nr:DUF87 domain-containing protein [Clostridium baratii]CUQ30244.1 Type IV secretory pathway VirB4 component-like protein [Clostridium baratii]